MHKQNIYFIVLVSLFAVLSVFILYNFIIVLVLAYLFAVLIRPIYKKLNRFYDKIPLIRKVSNPLASFTTILLFLIIIIVPVSLLLSKVVMDTQSVYNSVINQGMNMDFVSDRVKNTFSGISPSVKIDFNKIAESVSSFFVNNVGHLFSGTVDIVLKLFLFLFAMFYFLKDGKQFRELYSVVSPLKRESDDKIFLSIKQSVRSIMIGSMTVSIAQGIFTGFGFWLFGVPNPFFFGTLAGFMAFIPGVGPSIVWIPAAIYLYFTRDGSFVWLYQVIWGVFAVGLIDNFLGPQVINKGIKLHPLFILLSIIGGISVFGPEGFIFGPLILSVFVAIIKVWNEDKDTSVVV